MSYAVDMRKDRPMISTVLVEFRLARGYSQRELARLMDVKQSYINWVETGKVEEPIEYIKRIKKWLTKDELNQIKEILKSRIDDEIGE